MKIKGKEFKGVIFDLDGTLLDSHSIWIDVDKAFFSKRNIEMPKDYSDSIGHIGLDKAADYTIKRFNLDEKKEDILKEWKDGVLYQYAHNVKLKAHAKELLEFLKANNIPFCAATANDEDCYKTCLINNGIYDLFSFILEVNNFSHGKDNPEIYNEASKKLGVNPNECIVFEDLALAISTAKKANFITVGVYEASSKEEEIKENESYLYIKDFLEVINEIK